MTLADRLGDLVEANGDLGDAPRPRSGPRPWGSSPRPWPEATASTTARCCAGVAPRRPSEAGCPPLPRWTPSCGPFPGRRPQPGQGVTRGYGASLGVDGNDAGPGDGPALSTSTPPSAGSTASTKQGARVGYTKVRGYHPLAASLAGTGDVRGCEPGEQRPHRPGGQGLQPGALVGHDRRHLDLVVTTPTLRRRYTAIPGHLTRSGRRLQLPLAKDWPAPESSLLALGRGPWRCSPPGPPAHQVSVDRHARLLVAPEHDGRDRLAGAPGFLVPLAP